MSSCLDIIEPSGPETCLRRQQRWGPYLPMHSQPIRGLPRFNTPASIGLEIVLRRVPTHIH